MEAARLAAEDAHRQHMEAFRQLEENRSTAPAHGPEPRPLHREWSLKTSWSTIQSSSMERPVQMSQVSDWKTSREYLMLRCAPRRVGWPSRCTCSRVRLNTSGSVWSPSWRRDRNQLLGMSLGGSFSLSTSLTTSSMLKRWNFCSWLKGTNL